MKTLEEKEIERFEVWWNEGKCLTDDEIEVDPVKVGQFLLNSLKRIRQDQEIKTNAQWSNQIIEMRKNPLKHKSKEK